jgi:hypothetical protein
VAGGRLGRLCAKAGGVVEDNRNALRMRDRDLRARLEVGWEYVRPGGIGARDRRYVARFLELLGEYEEVQDRLSAIAPDEGEIEVLIWSDCGEWVFDRVWERRL